jgi:hypothetical protein
MNTTTGDELDFDVLLRKVMHYKTKDVVENALDSMNDTELLKWMSDVITSMNEQTASPTPPIVCVRIEETVVFLTQRFYYSGLLGKLSLYTIYSYVV